MWAILALGSAALTSLNPILYKRMLKNAEAGRRPNAVTKLVTTTVVNANTSPCARLIVQTAL